MTKDRRDNSCGYPWTKYRWIDPVFINRLKIVVGLILFVNKD